MTELSPVLKQATPVTVDHGSGCYLYGTDGRRYLDFTAGIGVTSTGHCHPQVVAAAQAQVATLIHGQYTTVMHKPLLELTEQLGSVLPDGLDTLFFANSGSEAVEAALRLARQATGRPNVIVFHGGFHGRTVAAASMTTSGTRFSAGFSPLMSGVHVAPFPTAYRYGWTEEEATEFALRELDYIFATLTSPAETAAFIVEPVLGEGGYIPGNRTFFRGLRERADEHGILLVVDEIQTGFGRTGKFFGHQHFDIRPDVITIGKGLASGFPLSGIATSRELMAKVWPGSQGGTYGGNAVACAAAIATLQVIESENLVQNAAERGTQLLAGMRAHDCKAIGDVRGLGLLVGAEFTTADGRPDRATATAAQQLAARKGLLLLTCGAYMNVVRMIPPLIVTETQVDDALGIWSDVLAEL
ncbi:aspartate aminotransferase family protein [Nocardia donostiensis]|uniref:(S)-3-amino-2-methylpropionate transaminase n=1 Tax=Nocardia donostiensis TaxID=1538463 RepID=A0A1W0AU27_9NOCA|nr:aminotransferase class III-fold pyridoxal phosphate-dependent enzyme [Nocardia donostiensis]ONM47813.1 aspartate aminotransferase family protein [Nocardia donostiensis]OQS13743.1 aspartate aminotransferase family protein [Nocardia donostiensis]OQS22565.1 aspartate aminotransferase family protein [Nocardia donostiensis]